MRAILTILLLAFVFGACAGPPRWSWQHLRYGEEELRVHEEECRKEARYAGTGFFGTPGFGQPYYEEKEDIYRRCMEAQGWEQVEISETL